MDIQERVVDRMAWKFLPMAPTWMDLDDLKQEARLAQLQVLVPPACADDPDAQTRLAVRAARLGIINALRRTKRWVKYLDKSGSHWRARELSLEAEEGRQRVVGHAALTTHDTPETLYHARERWAVLLAQLPAQEQTVLRGLLQDWSARALGARMGYTEARISQLRTNAIARLQAQG
jgi:RNA polymerase sigma factor (sigma-70 family)